MQAKLNTSRRRKNPFDRKAKKRFLEILSEAFSEEYAIRKLRINRDQYYEYKRETESWVHKVNEAKAAGIKALEDEAIRRGSKGLLDPVVSSGKIVTFRRIYSDKLLSEALRAKSQTYATARNEGSDFTDTITGASEILLAKLVALAEDADRLDSDSIAEARRIEAEAANPSSKRSRRSKAS